MGLLNWSENMAYYCVYQSFNQSKRNPSIIFGIGTSIKSAEKDALQYLDAERGLNGLFVSKCTKKVYDYIKKYGDPGDTKAYEMTLSGYLDFKPNFRLI